MKPFYLFAMAALMSISQLACLKTNSTVPISALQEAIAGHWQADSMVTMIPTSDQNYFDTAYQHHFIDITCTGSRVIIHMDGYDDMQYSIADSLLQPYTSNRQILPGRHAVGCGMPYTGTKISYVPKKLQLINYGIPTQITYLHRNE